MICPTSAGNIQWSSTCMASDNVIHHQLKILWDLLFFCPTNDSEIARPTTVFSRTRVLLFFWMILCPLLTVRKTVFQRLTFLVSFIVRREMYRPIRRHFATRECVREEREERERERERNREACILRIQT